MKKIMKIIFLIIIIAMIIFGTYYFIQRGNFEKEMTTEKDEIKYGQSDEVSKSEVQKEDSIEKDNSEYEKKDVVLKDKYHEEKKNIVEKDELEYGDNYEVFESKVYKEKPKRIVVKKENTTNEFFIFDEKNTEYEHLLKVALDRMYYSAMQDYNLWSFTPYSLKDITNSNENFIIFDYDDDVSQKDYLIDTDFNRDIFFRFSTNTRLFRLIDYLTYDCKKYSSDELRNAIGKEEFVPKNQIISGYKYMNPDLYSN